MIPKGVVGEFRISHRFGTIEEGFYDIFGLDNAPQSVVEIERKKRDDALVKLENLKKSI